MSGTSVYFIQAVHGGPIKIGLSADPANRLRELQTASPYTLHFLRVVPGEHREEGFLHERFADTRLSGEWFRPTPALMAVIESQPFDWKAATPDWSQFRSLLEPDQCQICGFRLDVEYEGFWDTAEPERPVQCRACIDAAPYRQQFETEENLVSPSEGHYEDVPLR